ncbi:PREDICTED: octapeptide-repeat protein T2-like [Vollenhovia emeryi]|uniref:octapeptide-repeat protein T2-like n=1 Tax=Vollenhovia emeryi TaxID=411798 RepID=UPI0005F40660|nr:PREDICTED: octapeptide-repeat protein T2-like [Vollenhovia emeryi]
MERIEKSIAKEEEELDRRIERLMAAVEGSGGSESERSTDGNEWNWSERARDRKPKEEEAVASDSERLRDGRYESVRQGEKGEKRAEKRHWRRRAEGKEEGKRVWKQGRRKRGRRRREREEREDTGKPQAEEGRRRRGVKGREGRVVVEKEKGTEARVENRRIWLDGREWRWIGGEEGRGEEWRML